LPMALAGSGSFVTLEPSSHTLTNIQAIRAFTTVNIQAEVLQADAWKITIQSSVGSD
jgi:RNA 3'-terminal phosphate cyclase (ATP)